MSATETTNINDKPFVYIAVCIYLRNRQAFQEKFTLKNVAFLFLRAIRSKKFNWMSRTCLNVQSYSIQNNLPSVLLHTSASVLSYTPALLCDCSICTTLGCGRGGVKIIFCCPPHPPTDFHVRAVSFSKDNRLLWTFPGKVRYILVKQPWDS